MTKRIKPPVVSVPAITSIEEADSTLARISALRRTLDLIQTGMNEDVDLIKAKTAKEAEPYNQEIAVLEQSLMRYADYHKDSLFKGRKSVALSFGSFGFRSSSKLKLFGKMTWERVLQSLRDNGLTTCIRIKEEPDIGVGADPEVCGWMYSYLYKTLLRLASAHMKTECRRLRSIASKKQARASFLWGAVAMIAAKLRQQKKELPVTSDALVPVKKTLIAAAMPADLSTRSVAVGKIREKDWMAGHLAASSVPLSTPIKGSPSQRIALR